MYQIAPVQRTRKSPYFESTIAAGVAGFSVYNHMLMPIWYESPIADYWYLVKNVSMWDVAVERQVEITGPDAYHLAQLLTPRDISKCKVGQGKYVPIVDENGGMINDPIMLRLGENHVWLSIADSDVLLWAKGVAVGMGLDVNVIEPDVSPLAIQGPNWLPVCKDLLGDWVETLKFFWFREFDFDGIPLVVQRSGWSKQGGLELYLRDGSKGNELWERVADVGKKYDIKPGTPSTIERIEGGLLSYGNEMIIEHNPLEIGLGKYCHLEQSFDFIGKAALQKVRDEGITRKLVGVYLEYDEPTSAPEWWYMKDKDGKDAGMITSATYSPRLERNIGMAMVSIRDAEVGNRLIADTPHGDIEVVTAELPFIP